MHEITLHLKYAYEAICYHEGHKRSREKAKNLEDLPLYSLLEARTLADLSAKFLKANLDSGTDIKTLIVLECSETTVSISLYRFFSVQTLLESIFLKYFFIFFFAITKLRGGGPIFI